MLVAQLVIYAKLAGETTHARWDVLGNMRPSSRTVLRALAKCWSWNETLWSDKGPLSKSCSCGRNRSPLIGVSDSDEFHTSNELKHLESEFWELCPYDVTLVNRGLIPLGMQSSQKDFAIMESARCFSVPLFIAEHQVVTFWTLEMWQLAKQVRLRGLCWWILLTLIVVTRSSLRIPAIRYCGHLAQRCVLLWKVSSVSTSASSSRLDSVSSCSHLAELPSFLSSNGRARLTQTTMSDPWYGSVSFTCWFSLEVEATHHTPVGLDGSCSVPVGEKRCAGPLDSDEYDGTCWSTDSFRASHSEFRTCWWIDTGWWARIYSWYWDHPCWVGEAGGSPSIAEVCRSSTVHASWIHKIWRSRALTIYREQNRDGADGSDERSNVWLKLLRVRWANCWSCNLPLPLQQQSWSSESVFPTCTPLPLTDQYDRTLQEAIHMQKCVAPRTCSTKPHFYVVASGKGPGQEHGNESSY